MDRNGVDSNGNRSDLDGVAAEFDRRYRIKKSVNAVFNLLIAVSGTFVFLYTIIVLKRSVLSRLKYLTFCSTLFTSAVSLFTFIVCILEAKRRTEVTKKAVYFLRLSAALTESIVLCFSASRGGIATATAVCFREPALSE